jgi:hypothetical protein
VIDGYHRLHPVTGTEFDYEHVCRTCANFSSRTRMKVKVLGCALRPDLDGKSFDMQNREAFPACTHWTPDATKPRPS